MEKCLFISLAHFFDWVVYFSGIEVHKLLVSFHLLYFFLPVFEDNDLLFWVPDVLCQHSEVVLWNLLSPYTQMFFR